MYNARHHIDNRPGNLYGSLRAARLAKLLLALMAIALLAASWLLVPGPVSADLPVGQTSSQSLHSDNDAPYGVWANSSTVWVADETDDKLYAYNRSDWSRKPAQDFNTLAAAGNGAPRGIWSDGTTMFVVDAGDLKLYAYNMSDKSHDSAKDIPIDSANDLPRGVWGNADTIWVAENELNDSSDKIFAYKRSDGTHDTAKDFTTLNGAGNNAPRGIWSDGTTMWVADTDDDKLFAYRMADRSRDPDKDIDLHSDNEHSRGIWSDGNVMLVTDANDDKAYIYTLYGILLHSNNGTPRGVWGNDDTIWVANDSTGAGNKIFAYNRATGARDSSKDFNTLNAAGNTDIQGIWSDGTTMFVVDYVDDKLYAYTVSTKARDSSKDITLNSGNNNPRGIWGNADTIWVSEDDTEPDNKIYAYTRSNGNHDSSKDFDTLNDAGNTDVEGIWSDGTTMWVADPNDDTVYAYKMADESRDSDKDFDLVSDNDDPKGMWSDGDTVYVVDPTDDKLYLYQLEKPNATGAPAVRGPGDTEFWSATLTAGVLSAGFGYRAGTPPTGSLSPGATFALDSVTYTVEDLLDSGANRLTINVDREIPVAFTLNIDGTPLHSGNVTSAREIFGGSHQYVWDAPSVVWEDGSTAQVSLTLHTDIVLGQALRADTFGISDADGKPAVAQEFTYQWVRVDGGDDTDIPGATAPFYYPTADDVGKSLKVKVEFEDLGGVSEGPLTSAASAAIAGSDSVKVLWSSTMTVGLQTGQSFNTLGYSSAIGSIADDAFTRGGTAYTVPGVSYFTNNLNFGVSPELGATQLANWRFGVAGAGFDLDEGNHRTQAGASLVTWTGHNQLWNEGDRIALAVMVVNSPATGAPAISGTPQVGEALTAETAGISDGNGLPDDAQGFTYQWQRSGGGSLSGQESLHSDNEFAVGVWGNTDTVWVTDSQDDKIYAYNRSDWSRKPAQDFDTTLAAAGNIALWGIWSDGTTMFVVDAGDLKLYAYNMSDKSHDSAKDITLDSVNDVPRGVWGNADTIWVVEDEGTAESKIFAYRRSDGTHDTAKDFDTLDGAGNNSPRGIWSDGTTMWVADPSDDKVYAYRMSDQSRDPGNDFDLHSDNGLPQGIWSDGNAMHVVDSTDDTVYIYARPGYTDITGATAPDYYPTDADAGRHIRVQVSFTDGDDFDEGPINSVGRVTRGNVFTGTLTAAPSGSTVGYQGAAFQGALAPNTFSYQEVDHTVASLITNGGNLIIRILPVPDTSAKDELTLVIGSNRFRLSDATFTSDSSSFSWANSGISWSAGQTVSIAIEGDIYDATADVIVQPSTTVSVPWSATVTVGEETGGTLDGFLGSALAFLTTPFGALPDMDIDIVGQDSHSVVGVTYDSSGSGTLTLYVDLAFAGLVRLGYGADATLATTAATEGTEGAFDKYDWSPHDDPGWAVGDRVAFAVVVNQNVAATGAPVVGGTYQTGQVLTADPSGITDPNGVTTAAFEYQWERVSCGTASDEGVISGETSSTYTVDAADLDCSLEVTVTFNDDDGYPEARSTTISPRGGIDGIAVTSDPGDDDTYAEGDWIEVSVTYNEAMTVSGTPRLELDIGGTPRQADYHAASSSSTVLVFRYRVGTTDLDADGLAVSASKLTLNGGGLSTVATPVKDGSLFNPALAADSDHMVDGVAPTLVSANVAASGQEVRIDFSENIDGTVSGSVVAGRFTLRRSDNSTVTASSASFTGSFISLSDLSHRIQDDWTLTLEYDDPSGNNADVVQDLAGNDLGDITGFSVNNTSSYVPNSLPTGFPTISGTVALNQVLTVDTSNIADANGLGAFSYQWSRTGCTDPNDDGNISGANSATYTVVAADLDCVLKVTVTYTDDDQYDEELSALTIDFTLANWSLSRNRSSVTEGGTVTVTLRITNGHTYSSAVTAAVYYGDTAVADGGLLAAQDGTHTITVPAGQNRGTVTLTARDDDLYNYQNGSTAVQLTARVGQQTLGSAVSLTVRDNEARPSITLSASGDRVIEGESITLTATAQPRYAGTMSVTLSHTDSRSVLTGAVPTTLEFAAGASKAVATITTQNDDTEKLNAQVRFTISSPSAPGRLGSPRSVTLDWVDDDGPPVIGTPRDGLKRIWYLDEASYGYRPAHGLRFYWWSVTGAVEYKLEYRKTGDTGAWSQATIGDFDQSPSITDNRILTGVPVGLECGTSYDVRLSLRGARPDHADAFGPYVTRPGQWTGPCPKPEAITNVVRTAEADCFTITWARPTNTAWTGYRVARHTLGPDDAEPVREVLHERVNDSSTRFRDCSNEYGLEGHSYIYDVQYLYRGASASDLESAPRIFGPTIDSGAAGPPFSPRNLRLTRDTPAQRIMTWEAPPNHYLTANRALRGDLRRGNVTDPWINGYIVERREYTGDPENPTTIEYPAGSSWKTVREGYDDNTRTSYTDNENRGTTLYVYRIRTTSPGGVSSEYTNDYLWDAPVVFVDPGEIEQAETPGEDGESSRNSPPTGRPAIRGTVTVGETLTADTSGIADADGLTNPTFSYQWIARGSFSARFIQGATAPTYQLSSVDQDKTIRVRVTFYDDGGHRQTLTSAATAAVEPRPNAEPTGLPTISGTAQVGQTLTADVSGIADEDGLTNPTFSYQWMRDDADVVGETAQTYDLSGDDVGKTIRVRVTYTDDWENEETLTSAATAAVEYVAGPPGAPLEVEVQAGDTEIRVSWQLPAHENKAPVQEYRVRYREEGGSDQERLTTGLSETLDGLTNGVTYVVQVEARNAAGYGTSSAELRSAPRPPAPETPEGFTAQAVHHLRMALDWDDVEGADRYEVQFYDFNTRTLDVLPFNGITVVFDGSSAVVDNLPEGRFWWLAVRAVNLGGASEWTELDMFFPTRAADWENNAPTGLPTIGGTAQAGQTLTASTSGIDDEDGLDNVSYSYQWMRDDADIAGETAQTYDLTDDDVGKTIKVRVTFTDDREHEETLTSVATAAVEARPNNAPTGLPTISGTAQAGQTLTANTSGIGDEDGLDNVSYSYQWMRDDADIAGETAQTYDLSDDDVGKTIRVRVTFTDDREHEETLTSAATAAVEARPNVEPTGLPTISGTAQAGETLTASTSGIDDEDGLDNVSYSYQWVRDDADIAGETAQTYEVTDGDVGKTIKVRVTFTDDREHEESLTSAATAAVEARKSNAVSEEPATVTAIWSATLTVGAGGDRLGYSLYGPVGELSSTQFSIDETTYIVRLVLHDADKLYLRLSEDAPANLTLHIGAVKLALDDASPINGLGDGTYQWPRGAVSWSAGDTVPLILSLTGDEEGSDTAQNAAPTGLPTITGTAQAGEALTATTSGIGDADGLDNVVYSYQWIANDGNDDADIAGETARTYEVTDDDVGKTIKVRVTFTDDADNEETLTSAATAAVEARPNAAPTGLPAVTGTPQVGETLTADTSAIDDADGLDNAVFRYQWFAIKSGVILALLGETSSTYTLAPTNEGYTFQVRVSFTDDRENEESLTSAATAAVVASATPEDTTPPQKTSIRVDGATLRVLYDEDLDEASTPPADAFDVRVTCGCDDTRWWHEEARRGVDGVSVSGDTVVLTLASAVKSGDYVVVSYTPPSDDAAPRTRDVAGNAAAGFGAVQATNNTEEPSETVEPPSNAEPTGLPTITGTARVGETLTADTSGIADADGLVNPAFAYQWLRDDADIAGETARTYDLSDEDVGKTIKVRVTFTDDADNEESLTSAATGAVEARPNSEPTGLPTIAGTAQAGETLTASTSGIGDEDGLDNVSYSYQWLRDDADIAGETAQTYDLSDDDVGKTIKVRVTFTDDAENVETLTSTATEPVTVPLWSATLTAGSSGTDSGYIPDQEAGSISEDEFSLGVFTYRVKLLLESDDGLLSLGVDGSLPTPFTLQVGADRFASEDAAILKGESGYTYQWDEGSPDWSDGEEVDVALTVPETPLAVSLENAPDSHTGAADVFTFELRFSEEVPVSYLTLRDHVFTVTGGTITKATRLTQGSNIGWRITVQPDSTADVTIVLPVTTDCNADGAICTGDGRKLSNSLSFTVSGPGG